MCRGLDKRLGWHVPGGARGGTELPVSGLDVGTQLPVRLQSTWDSRMQLVRLQSYEAASSAQTGPNNAVSRASAGPEDPAAEPTRSRSYGGVEKGSPADPAPLLPGAARGPPALTLLLSPPKVKFLEVIKPFCVILPEIQKPERKVSWSKARGDCCTPVKRPRRAEWTPLPPSLVRAACFPPSLAGLRLERSL
ncbi:SEC61A1 [Cervus elaphus hippelaphus]|uniref:SEC61A1 n=1 Tax=Cervus elaphus hippelaphus TaxID=46360 RepID=A0A212CA33_CEREH|nr:SEC61A1 [Cervus elaphus hippelaphus]